jgi:hypothetical protein
MRDGSRDDAAVLEVHSFLSPVWWYLEQSAGLRFFCSVEVLTYWRVLVEVESLRLENERQINPIESMKGL